MSEKKIPAKAIRDDQIQTIYDELDKFDKILQGKNVNTNFAAGVIFVRMHHILLDLKGQDWVRKVYRSSEDGWGSTCDSALIKIVT